MPVDPAVIMLLDDLKTYGCTLVDLAKNNRLRSLEHPKDAYYLGKVDAYEVAYEELLRLLKKVNSYQRSVA